MQEALARHGAYPGLVTLLEASRRSLFALIVFNSTMSHFVTAIETHMAELKSWSQGAMLDDHWQLIAISHAVTCVWLLTQSGLAVRRRSCLMCCCRGTAHCLLAGVGQLKPILQGNGCIEVPVHLAFGTNASPFQQKMEWLTNCGLFKAYWQANVASRRILVVSAALGCAVP